MYLVLENPTNQTFKRISWLVVAINFFAFLFLAYRFFGHTEFYLPLSAALLLAAFALYAFNKKPEPGNQPLFIIPFIISGITWLLMANYLMLLAMTVIIIWERTKKAKLVLAADDEEIVYPSFPVKKYKWNEIENIVLKDGLLTIDFKNNKLIQVYTNGADIDEFKINNTFKLLLSK